MGKRWIKNKWRAQFQYVLGNVNLRKKIENLERTNQQSRHDRYKKNLRARRNKWKEVEAPANKLNEKSSCCNCSCNKIKGIVNPKIQSLSDFVQKNQKRFHDKKHIPPKDKRKENLSKSIFKPKVISEEMKPDLSNKKTNEVLNQIPIEPRKQ